MMSVRTTVAVDLSTGLDWLLSLSRKSVADPSAELGWQYALPAWVWAAIIVGAVATAVLGYRRILGARSGRVVLATVRAMLIVLIAALLAGPRLVVWVSARESDQLLVLVDRSESMKIRDMNDPAGTRPISRDVVLRQSLDRHTDMFKSEQFTKDRRVVWLGFDAGTFPITTSDLQPPDGATTAIRTVIDQALRHSAEKRICGIVLMTDGRSRQDTGAEIIRRLNRRAAPVFAVPFGADVPTLDLAVAQVDWPGKAFVNDIVPVTVHLEHDPAERQVDQKRVTVRLVDLRTGAVLDQKHPDDPGLTEPIRLSSSSEAVGPVKWRVEAVYDPPEGQPGESVTENNRRSIELELTDQPIRVLYVEGYPRWEYRYLKNMLLREKSIESSIMLTSADRKFAQEGDIPLARLPDNAEQIRPYDVLIVGDVPSGYFSPAQLALIRRHVGTSGAGLLWIAGATHTPRSYEATDLAALLPMRHPAAVALPGLPEEGLALRRSPLAVARGLLRLRSPDAAASQAWPGPVPPLRWAQDIGELKPAAEVIVETGAKNAPVPVITTMRYGAGQIIYVATDETWRWRYGRGGFYFDQAWLQLVRMLGRGRIQQDNRRVRLSVTSRRVDVRQVVVVSLEADDPLALGEDLKRIRLDVTQAGVDQATPIERIELFPVAADASTEADSTKRYQATWRPAKAGSLVLSVVEPALAGMDITARIEVVRPDDELRHPRPDHERLRTLAEQTGGKVIPPDELDQLTLLVRDDRKKTDYPQSESLWDSYLALFLALLLLTGEWVGRKLIRLA